MICTFFHLDRYDGFVSESQEPRPALHHVTGSRWGPKFKPTGSHKERAMWRHQAGRIDFDEPLFRLMRRGWTFREYAATAASGAGAWAVIGVEGRSSVRADCSERRDAWAEAVRLALLAAVEHRPHEAALRCGTRASSTDDPTVCDEERARFKAMGWSFSEHLTAQENGREGWVVSGNWGGRRIRAMEDDRADAWATVLILAAVTRTAASGRPNDPPRHRPNRLRHSEVRTRALRGRL
jgi:hypothetical protein